MRTVNIHEAKTHLSRLVQEAAQGKPFVIARAGKPLVKVIPYYEGAPATGRLGFMKGEIEVPDDFDEMGAEAIEAMFGGERERAHFQLCQHLGGGDQAGARNFIR